jgi:hypothetical protein
MNLSILSIIVPSRKIHKMSGLKNIQNLLKYKTYRKTMQIEN